MNPLTLLSDREPLSEAMDTASRTLSDLCNNGEFRNLDVGVQFALRCLPLAMMGWTDRVRAMEERLRIPSSRELEALGVMIHPAREVGL